MAGSVRLTEAEMRSILEEIARSSGNSAARIAAIKQLRRMGEKARLRVGMSLSG